MARRLQLAPNPDHRWNSDGEVQVRGFGFDRLTKQIVNMHASPLGLSYPKPRGRRPHGEETGTRDRGNWGTRTLLQTPVAASPCSPVPPFPFVGSGPFARSTDTTRHT